MIENGIIRYGSRPALLDFEFHNSAANTFFVALLTTFLSYQATSLIFDVSLGFKYPNKARACDMHVLLLTRRSSPLAVLASILRVDWLTRAQFKANIATDEGISREDCRIKPWIAAILLFLLVVTPLINIFAIIITFEREVSLSFREARFGGIAVGIGDNFSVTEKEKFGRFCEIPKLRYERGDSGSTSILLCRDRLERTCEHGHGGFPLGTVSVAILAYLAVHVFARLNGYYASQTTSGKVAINTTEPFNLRAVVSEASARALVDLGVIMMSKACGQADPYVLENINHSQGAVPLSVTKHFRCPYPVNKSKEQVDRIVAHLSQQVTFVNYEEFEVYTWKDRISMVENISDVSNAFEDYQDGLEYPPFLDVKDYPFLVRRKRIFSLPAIAILGAALLTLRLGLKIVSNNDVAEGVHRTLKRRVGLLSWKSLLRTNAEIIQHDHKLADRDSAPPKSSTSAINSSAVSM